MKKLSMAMEIRFALEKLKMGEDATMDKLMRCPKEILALLLAETRLLINFKEI